MPMHGASDDCPYHSRTMKLSVLDQSIAVAGQSEDAAIRSTLELAPWCESLGYHRFWLSEHHSLPTIVGTAPEILLAAIAARTRRIRIGSAGVMLPHYSALKVAEQFRVLDALAPGRVDLGVGRAPGADMATALLLNPNAYSAAEHFPEQVRDLHAWLSGAAYKGVIAHPRGTTAPEIWILGSSNYGAQLAAHFGLPYAYAYFFSDGEGTEEAMRIYHSTYKPTEERPKPQATLCVWALAADDEALARHHALSRDRWRIDRMRGAIGPLQSPDVIAARGFTSEEMTSLEETHRKSFVGDAAQVATKLRALAETYDLDELVVNTWTYDPAIRRRSYELLAREFMLGADSGAAEA
jgi:luciferase family oxidoreductase group 1